MFKSLKAIDSDNPTEINRADVDEVVQVLQNNDGDFYTKFQEGVDKFGTAPLRDAYLCLSHTNMITQFQNVAGFQNKAQYPVPSGSLNSAEWGAVGNLRVFTSSRGSITLNSSLLGNDVYNNFVCAQEGYSCSSLEGGKVGLFYHGPGHGDDACHLRQTLGFRFTFGTTIDQDLWVINLAATLA